jgi:hypothetical protein
MTKTKGFLFTLSTPLTLAGHVIYGPSTDKLPTTTKPKKIDHSIVWSK